jgi:hypothetical protein
MVPEECSDFLLNPGLGPYRIVGIEEMGEGREMFAEMVVAPRLPYSVKGGVRHLPHPGGTITYHLPNRQVLPARLLDHLLEVGGQVLCRAQDAHRAVGEEVLQMTARMRP